MLFYRSEQQDSYTTVLKIGGIQFSSVEAVKTHTHQIVGKYKEVNLQKQKKYHRVTDESDCDFLFDLFAKHSKAEEKLGSTKQSILFGKNSNYKGKVTHCFYLEQEDGNKEEISYIKCLSEIRDQAYASQRESMAARYKANGAKIAEFFTDIIKSFPLSKAQVMQSLMGKFPYKKVKIEQQYSYFKMLLEIANQSESLEEQILSICIDKLIQIDADINISKKNQSINNVQEIEAKHNVIYIFRNYI